MAIVKMNKFTLLTFESKKEELLRRLQGFSNVEFINLQDELAGTENRIAVARKDYNDAVKEYNNLVKTFPNNLTASLFNFKEKSYFEVNNSDKEVPNVSFE